MILGSSLTSNSLICVNCHSLLSLWIRAHSHFLFEINFCLLVRVLPILDLSVPLVNQVIASSNMVVSVVLDTFLSVLFVEIVLGKKFVEELLVNWHLFFAWE